MNNENAVIQIGIVVADARKAASAYARLLGIHKWHINRVDTSKGIGRNFRSADGEIPVKSTIAWTEIAGIEIELIEPNDEYSPYAEFLRQSGPGVHHIMLATDNFESDVGALEDLGVPVILAGELQATRFQLFDTRDTLGTIIEFAKGGTLKPDESLVING